MKGERGQLVMVKTRLIQNYNFGRGRDGWGSRCWWSFCRRLRGGGGPAAQAGRRRRQNPRPDADGRCGVPYLGEAVATVPQRLP